MSALHQGISAAALTVHLGSGSEIDYENDWQVVWEANSSGQTDTNSQSGNTIRNMVEFPYLAHTNRNKIRVTFAASVSGTEDFGIDATSASIGNKDMSEPGGGITAELDQTKLTFNAGSTSFSAPANTQIVSDPIEFLFIPGSDMGLVFRFGGSTVDSARVIAGDGIYHDARNGVFYGTDDSTFHAYNGYGIGVVKVEAAFSPNWLGTPEASIGTTDSFWGGKTIRMRIDDAVIVKVGTKIKIKIRTPDTDAVTAMYVGIGASSGDAYDFAAAPVPITFNGGNSSSGAPGTNDYIESDFVDFTFAAGDDILISAYIDTGKSVYRGSPSYQPDGWDAWYVAGNDASTQNATGYSGEGACPLIVGFTSFNETYTDGSGAGNPGETPPDEPDEDSSGPPTASGDWEEMLAGTLTPFQSAISGFANRTFRMVIRKGAIANVGSAIKIVFYGGAGGFYITDAFLNRGSTVAGEKPWNFANAYPSRITFNGGSHSVTIGEGEFVESDPIGFDIINTVPFVISYYTPTSARPFWSRGFGGFAVDGACYGVHGGGGNDAAGYPNGTYGVGEAGAVIFAVRDVMVIDASATTQYNSTVDDNFWAGKDVRALIDSSVLTRTGSKIAIKFRTPDTDAISNCYIGLGATSGDAYDFASTPTRVTFDGGNNASGAPGQFDNSSKWSDFVDLNVGTGDSILVAMELASGKNVKRGSPGDQLTGWDFYVKTGGDPSTVDASGYSGEGATPCLVGLNII